MSAFKNWIFLLMIFPLVQLISQGEVNYDNEVHPPLDIPMYLSGTFGELRTNHFHSGLDIKTQGVEGLNIYAADDGYVSRIKVSPNGYGKVLYITHPSGLVSVYGHLQRFNDTIQQYVKELQYKNESFSVHKYPKKGELTVRKGEVIAYSGNSGGSSGPHLHYELREETSQHPLNPLFFNGIQIKDTYRPKILELAIYPVDQYSRINGKNDTVFVMVSGSGKQHYLGQKNKIKVSGRISFGIRTYDPMDDISNKNGVYQIEMQIDTLSIFKIEMDKLSFATTRYMNSLIDYNYYKKMRRKIIRTQIDTNNRLFNYRDIVSNGIYTFNDTDKHTVRFLVKDVYDNTSKLTFEVVSEPNSNYNNQQDLKLPDGVYFSFRKQNDLDRGNIALSFPPNSFYQSFYFQIDSLEGDSITCSPYFQIHNHFTPVQKHYSIAIKPYQCPDQLKDKLYIALINGRGAWYIGSKWEDDRITASSRSFGRYAIMADTISPEIRPVNVYDQKNIRGQKTIQVKIEDKETSISKFRATLNGKWILMEYDAKFHKLKYEVDDHLMPGKNSLKIEVEDMLENTSVYEATLIK